MFFQGFQPSVRKFSTAAVAATVCKENKEGLKFLVTAGPHAQKAIGIWLFVSAAWVFSMVVLGGVTRLTRSGLSMTDWKFTGSLPPLSEEDWLIEFEKYKQSPEFKRLVQAIAVSYVFGICLYCINVRIRLSCQYKSLYRPIHIS